MPVIRIICKVTWLGGENGQFQHNRPSNVYLGTKILQNEITRTQTSLFIKFGGKLSFILSFLFPERLHCCYIYFHYSFPVFFFQANWGKISPWGWGGTTTTTEVYSSKSLDTVTEWGLRCQVPSSDKGIFANFFLQKTVFLLVFYCFDSILKSFRL